jgi:hypothetical protein
MAGTAAHETERRAALVAAEKKALKPSRDALRRSQPLHSARVHFFWLRSEGSRIQVWLSHSAL